MKIKPFQLGAFGTNSYVIYDTDECYVVDAPDGMERLVKFVRDNRIKLCGVLLTHAHFDHIAGLPELLEAFPGLSIHVSAEDLCLVKDGYKRTLEQINYCYPPYLRFFPVNRMPEAEAYSVYGEEKAGFRVIKTPGHTPGSVSLYSEIEGLLFSGDTLFKGSIGRSDLGGSQQQLAASLRLLASLPDDTFVCPGHGQFTTIGEEKKQNPFL